MRQASVEHLVTPNCCMYGVGTATYVYKYNIYLLNDMKIYLLKIYSILYTVLVRTAKNRDRTAKNRNRAVPVPVPENVEPDHKFWFRFPKIAWEPDQTGPRQH